MRAKTKILISVFAVSLAANAYLGFKEFVRWFNSPADRLGVLTRDIVVGEFNDSKVIFRLPEGLTVKDETPQGLSAMGQFEPHRFSVIVTSDEEQLVNYDSESRKHNFGNYYSADIELRK